MEPQRPPTQPFLPPADLVHLESARQRFGASKVDLLIELMHTGDPLADAVIKEIEALGPETNRQLQQGISQGLHMLQALSPAVKAFLEEVEHLPYWVELERLKRGSDAYLSIGNTWILLSLGPGSLTHTYSSPSIARVLVQSGNLTRMAKRRIMETGVWNVASVFPGGLLRGADGYVHNLQVRLLHARVRQAFLKRNWDASLSGLPINQVELARTWLDFTYVPFSALQNFGITFSQQELADLYHFWQYIAYLLGVDKRLYRDILDQESAQELLVFIDSTSKGANEDSKALTQAMIEAVAELLHLITRLPLPLSFDVICAVTRRLHGDTLADQLGVKKTWISKALPLVILVNRLQRAWDNRSPLARQRAVAHTIRAFEQGPVLHGLTTYQRVLAESIQPHLPETRDEE